MFYTTLGSPTIPIPSHKSQHTITNPYERWAPEIFGEFPLAAPNNLLYYQSGLALSSLQERKAHTGESSPAVVELAFGVCKPLQHLRRSRILLFVSGGAEGVSVV